VDVFPSVLINGICDCILKPESLKKRTKKVNNNPVITASYSHLNIMVVDDNLVNQKVLKRILNRLGVENIQIVDNGQKAVDLEAAEPFDVVLMDMHMPVMDGVAACKHIVSRQGNHSKAKVIFVTAHVSDSFRAMCLENGAVGYLPKPCTIDTLQECLQNVL
jgi:CheY-like chemotaxis protein